ncbi:carbohydrate kinase [Rhodophyticola sp. CCM32]|uniref:carbohydrate kinase family protein n=1 Tax=Rhodophyticola sp. CCM32 TaxID=2916397 RepID=UPI00107EF942|nr:carbohydrate kinase [Rhodophyticola sp. CCM32]QBX99731.1 carbohydrate kinase [Rhodophyticola sp. CCM32]
MILCCGEALIDMLPRKTEDGAAGFAPYPGGAVFNTALALARLGAETGLFTGLSRDLFGQRLENVLRLNAVNSDRIARSDRPTTLAFVTLTDGQAEYAFYDENTAGRLLAQADLPQDLTGVEALFFGGISLAVEPCADAYEALCLRAPEAQLIMIDPNIRPDFIADAERYRARLARMLAVADVVKLSDEDLIWLEGDGDLASLARGLLDKGPKLVLITEGRDGVTAYSASGAVQVPAQAVEVVDTVGAGDTFNAGFLAGLSEAGMLTKAAIAKGLDKAVLTTALSLGVAAAAVTVSRAGANPPQREDVAI